MGEDDCSQVEVFHNLNEKSNVMATASLPFKQADQLDSGLNKEKIKDKLVIGREAKDVMKAKVQAIFNGKTKVKKKMRVEDIITNLKKVKQVESTSMMSMSLGNNLQSGVDTEEEESFASMCTIREELPGDYTDLIDVSTTKQNVEQTIVDNKPSPRYPVQRITPTTATKLNPVKQVILQTAPQGNASNQPLIINKLPPGFKLLPSGSLANLQNASKSGQPKLLLITKSGGPFFISQASTASQTQVKSTSSPIFSQAKPVSSLVNGRPMNLNNVGSQAKTKSPLITVQYNLPYPNNNCKVVNNPVNKQSRTFQTHVQTSDKMIVTEVPRATKPREMVVNFAGNQTAHITTMPDDTAGQPERQAQFIPSFVYDSPPDTSSIRNTKTPSPIEGKLKKQTFHVVKFSPTTTAITKVNGNVKKLHPPQRRSIYDEKIARLTGRDVNELFDDTKHISNGLQEKSNSMSDVRVSNRKRQQTEKAKLLEKAKKRKKSEESTGSEKLDGEKARSVGIDATSPKSESLMSPESKKTDSEPKSEKKKDDDPNSLFRDPSLLTREERALQRALMMFKELEEKQARKESLSDIDKSCSRKNEKVTLANTTDEVPRKRRVSKEGNFERVVKKRKRTTEEHSAEKTQIAAKIEDTDVQKNSEVVGKVLKEKTPLATEKSSTEGGKRKDSVKTAVPKKSHIISDPAKETLSFAKEVKKTVKDVTNTSKHLKPTQKTPDSTAEMKQRVNVKTYMLVPSYHGFKDFSPIVLGSRTRSKKVEPEKSEKVKAEEEEVPVTKTPEKTKKDIPLLVVETVGNKAVKQDVVAKDDQMRDFVKNSLRQQGMLKQELELTEKLEDTDKFENREKRHLVVNRNTGETVLHKASRMGYDETVYHCIQQGSDSNAKDNAGWTPLHEACSRGHADVVRVLVKYNADVNACSNDGIRPIHDAADNGNTDSLRLLLAYGADPFISTYSGRSVLDCAKLDETKDYIKACIGDIYLNDERNNIVLPDYENRWDFRGSCSFLDQDRKYLGDIFDNLPKQQPSNSVEVEWSETPHLLTYSLPLVKDGVVVGRKNYILLQDLQESLNKPRQNVVRLLKRTKIREVGGAEFQKEVASSYFSSTRPAGSEENKIELVPLNWTVRSLLKIKCEHLAL